jgi:heme exporter protein C
MSTSVSQLAPRASRPWWSILAWLAPLVLIATQTFGIVTSPPDRDMGHLQKIMYVHVPVAWNFAIAFVVVFVASVRYLWTKDERHDLLAASAAEVGTVLTALTIVLGSLWGRVTWGVWWTWDARLTSTAVLLMIFLSYLTLRSFTEDPERRARWSAAVGIFGALNVPIVYMSVRWWRTLHQVQSRPDTVDPAYAWGLRLNAIAVLLLMIYFIGKRYEIARAERLTEHRREELALRSTPEAVHA